ncbi:MgtC/SapB family protein [Ktedonospora formicarum]|uniref:MgtC/SapB/SrpB/YhiD N-terminal domain-containing protein n=1 Tax=Ktedonospora formicarum TaxID=2778364 RepID=A0A8J3MTZ2_9CHLR|nr:MgtC/SapB family protein [Ktedonospora formicarum]GHO48717.1 hypothetical protein KSX_68800 [Ktedonospora formicarum]
MSLTPNTPLMFTLQVAASVCIGLLIGLEREWAHKEAGIRSFAIAALLGTLSWMVSPLLASLQLSSIVVILLLVNVFSMWRHQALEITTSLALTATNVLGIVIGTGNFFLAITSGLVITALLTCKPEFVTVSGRLSVTELRSILLFGFITAILYPLLPHADLGPWYIVNLVMIWLTIVVVSSLNFANYILLRQFGSRGIG